MKYYFLFALCWFTHFSLAQKSLLSKPISLKLSNERLDNALSTIGQKAGFSFSYNPADFDLTRRVSISASNATVKEILDDIFKGDASYKERERHVILQKVIKPAKPQDVLINGLIFDRQTGKRLAKASIFEKRTLVSAVSDSSGRFKLRLPAGTTARLEVRKGGYFGTSAVVSSSEPLEISLVALEMEEKRPVVVTQIKPPVRDSLRVVAPTPLPILMASADTTLPTTPKRKIDLAKVEKNFVDAFASAKQAVHINNIQDTLYRPVQVSLLPFVGTNHIMSGHVINTLSFNIIAGYSLGVSALEIGGFANLVRRDVHGAQFAGFANLVGRNVYGLQGSGFANVTMNNFDGIQAAGFTNVTGGHYRGLQLAGFANLTGRSFSNGLQASGFANVTLGNMNGLQISGFGNVAAKSLRGLQISPYFNYAKVHKRGLQIALFNYADSSGALPIGLVSYVHRNGYRRLEIGTDEMNYGNITFKTGVAKLYNIITIGGSFGIADKPLYTAGYGVGTSQKWGKGWRSNLDFTFNRIMEATNYFDSANGIFYRASAGIEKRIAGRLALYAGPALTWLTARPNYLKLDSSRLYQPFPAQNLRNGLELRNWIGFQAGIRIVSADY